MTQEYFHKVIERVLEILGEDCKRNPDCYRKSGEEFEPLVVQAVKRAIYDEVVAVRVDYIPGGHRFPDIVLVDENGAKFGIEVKSSTGRGRSWKINGNSVMGTTKVSGLIENVIVFGKLHGENSEFRAKNYEQSISSVGVTHSPRFLIDMELPEGESFFDKSGITYAQLDSSDNPIKRITDYFLSIGQKAWWLAESTPATIRMFSDLSRYEQDHLMGYAFVQYSGAPFDSDKINLMQKQVGLPVVLTHVPMDRILNDTANLMEEHGKIGCKNIGLGMMPVATILDEQKCLQTVKLLDEAGKTMEQNGFKFFYHFHQFEFCKLSCGMRIIDYMLENCPHINFTADTYWMQFGGVDVTEYLKKMQGRIDCIHLKDYQIVYQNEKFVPRFAPLGKGNLNLNEIVKTAKQSGTKYFLVEQEYQQRVIFRIFAVRTVCISRIINILRNRL